LNLSLENKISALYVCADILDYPNKNFYNNIKTIENLTKQKYFLEDIVLEDICSEYIRIFSIQTTKLRCVPYASWWIDGKMSGKSLSKIMDFYIRCGYQFDAEVLKKPADNISSMIIFIAILAEENRFADIKEFTKFLSWMNDFANSLDNATDIKVFMYALNLSIKIINSFKEKL
jgi:TorA maturation chaperone TorD